MNSAIFVLLCAVASPLIVVQGGKIHLGMKGFIPRSCLDYLEHGVLENGFYWLFDGQDQRYVSYCDLSSEPGSAWTLVMSWKKASKDLPQFSSKPLLQDAPINPKTPNWNAYRQTLARMKSVRGRSTYWRATCSFNIVQEQIDYRDYLRGKFSNFDIISYLGIGECFPVDYVNIRGHAAGSGTTVKFWQWQSFMLHTDSSDTGCGFVAKAGSVGNEDNFGYYGDAVNTNFRCTTGPESTTQWWFGGYVAE